MDEFSSDDSHARHALLGETFSEAAHEIRNLMQVVIGLSEMELLTPSTPTEQRKRLKSIVSSAVMASELASSALRLSVTSARSEARVAPPIQLLADIYRHKTRHGCSLSVDVPADIPVVAIPEGFLQLALANLVRNAWEAVAQTEQSAIVISAHAHAGRVDIAVWNSGPAIPADVLPRLFMKSFTTKASGEGSGLGLYISRNLVERFGGKVSARNEDPARGGVTFTLSLKVAESAPTRPPSNRDSAAQPLRGKRVLVIDDDDAVRQILCMILKDLGCEMFFASATPEGALVELSNKNYDTILLDYRLKGQNARNVFDTLAEKHKGRFVIVTADPLNKEAREFFASRHAQILAKPVSHLDLSVAIVG